MLQKNLPKILHCPTELPKSTLNPNCLLSKNKIISKEEIMAFLDDLPAVYPLHIAAGNGNIGNFRYWMSENPRDPNPRDNSGLTPLHFAALKGRQQMCRFILDLPNVRDKNPGCLRYGATPLHIAASNGYSEVCKIFLLYLNDKNPGDNRGSTPLHYAAGLGQLEACNVIIENITNINPQNNNRATPCDYALKRGHFNLAKLFSNRLVPKTITIPGQIKPGNPNPNPQPRSLIVQVPSHELEEGPNIKGLNSPLLQHVLIQALPSVLNLSDDAAVQCLQLHIKNAFVAFCSFFPCSLTIVHRGQQKLGVDIEKALELTNSTVFHRGRQ